MEMMGAIELPNFDITKVRKKTTAETGESERRDTNMTGMKKRLQFCIEKCRNLAAKKWYEKYILELGAESGLTGRDDSKGKMPYQ